VPSIVNNSMYVYRIRACCIGEDVGAEEDRPALGLREAGA
jgi:hypothetical protein